MSESIITAESLQTDEANEQQDKVDSPDESKDENLETEKTDNDELSEDDATETTHTSGADETEKSEKLAEDDTEESPSDTEDTDNSKGKEELYDEKLENSDLPKGVKARLYREMRKTRKYEREVGELKKKVEQIVTYANQQQPATYDPATQMQDPFTGNIVDINSVEGQVALKLQQVSQVQEQVEKQQKVQKAQENLRRKLEKGRDKYDDFDDVTENAGITWPMLNAAYLSDDTAELLYNLVKYKPEEIDRISKLSPELQGREMAFLEVKMKQSTKKKIVKKVPEPPSKIKGSGSSMTDESDMSYEDLLKRRRKELEDRYRR